MCRRPWPSGSPPCPYRFAHDLFREYAYDQLPAAERAGLHQRIGQALASRTYGELAAVTADIPAELTRALPRRPPVRARRRIPFNTAVTGGACMAGLVNVGMVATLLSRSPVAVVLFVVFTIVGVILAIGAMIVAT